jgi:hypothetical protein
MTDDARSMPTYEQGAALFGRERSAFPYRIRTTASRYQCDCCPPDRVCAWACVQGAGVMDIIAGASLALEGVPDGTHAAPEPPGCDPALWDCYNA